MLHRLLIKARYLTLIPIFALLLACVTLYTKGGRLIIEQFNHALTGDSLHSNLSEIRILEGIDILLVGTGCLSLAIGMFSLFVRELDLPPTLKSRNFHDVKGTFANFVILAMAITFLEQVNRVGESESNLGGTEIFFSGTGIAVVTLALLAFKQWGGENNHSDRD